MRMVDPPQATQAARDEAAMAFVETTVQIAVITREGSAQVDHTAPPGGERTAIAREPRDRGYEDTIPAYKCLPASRSRLWGPISGW